MFRTTLVKYWGDRGTRPGQFNTPHSIVIDARANQEFSYRFDKLVLEN